MLFLNSAFADAGAYREAFFAAISEDGGDGFRPFTACRQRVLAANREGALPARRVATILPDRVPHARTSRDPQALAVRTA